MKKEREFLRMDEAWCRFTNQISALFIRSGTNRVGRTRFVRVDGLWVLSPLSHKSLFTREKKGESTTTLPLLLAG